MRAIILAAGATLAIAGCGSNNAAENIANTADDSFEAIVANDTTAIDAATNDAANMAAESDIMLEPIENETSNAMAPRERTPSASRDGAANEAASTPRETSTSNTTNAVANAVANQGD